MYKLPEKISLARWLKCKFYYPLRSRLKRQYLIDTIQYPPKEEIFEMLEIVERELHDAKLNSKLELARNYEGQKEILRWITTYGGSRKGS